MAAPAFPAFPYFPANITPMHVLVPPATQPMPQSSAVFYTFPPAHAFPLFFTIVIARASATRCAFTPTITCICNKNHLLFILFSYITNKLTCQKRYIAECQNKCLPQEMPVM